MQYRNNYKSPVGNVVLAADDTGLTGLWFEGQKYFGLYLDKEHQEKDLPIFNDAKRWLEKKIALLKLENIEIQGVYKE